MKKIFLLLFFISQIAYSQTLRKYSNEFLSIGVDPAFGFQFDYIDMIYLRGGIGNIQNQLEFDESRSGIFQPSLGVGFRYQGIQIDYALTNIGNVGNALYSNIFSLKVDFDYYR